jgi:hypothetical protein
MLGKPRARRVFAVEYDDRLQKEHQGVRTGVVAEKKSMIFPMVKGMLMDTDEDTSSNPTAANRGFRSGFASIIIFRNEDAFRGALENDNGRTRESIDSLGFDGTGAACLAESSPVEDV